jgi:CheY-like chemotaxis protein
LKPVALLVEDEMALSSIIADTLDDEELRLFLRKHPDILIADVMMPKMNNLEMVEKIRKAEKNHSFPVSYSPFFDWEFGVWL